MRNSGLIMIPTLMLIIGSPLHAESWGPWSASDDAPAILMQADRNTVSAEKRTQTEYRIAATPFIWLLKVYQNFISPLDGDRCNMYPTCSQYSVQAIRKHGPVIGIIMTSDRMIHEADEQRLSPAIKIGDRYRWPDSVENNDYWWYKK